MLINKFNYYTMMTLTTNKTYAQKKICERSKNKNTEVFMRNSYQAYEAYEDHVDSFVNR